MNWHVAKAYLAWLKKPIVATKLLGIELVTNPKKPSATYEQAIAIR